METTNKIPLPQRVLSIARSQIGNAEIPHGSNWGKHVQKYLASVGIDFAAPWCMSFIYWCVDEACKEAVVPNPLVRTGGVMRQYNEVDRKLIVKTPLPGDIGIMDFGKGLGHTFFVEKVEGDTVFTIEGNSNDDGSREGYEVCRKPGGRKIKNCKAFIRIG
jgi:hypothetical protein